MKGLGITPQAYLWASKLHEFYRALRPVPDVATVGKVLGARPPHRRGQLYSLPAAASAHDALALMLKENITAVLVQQGSTYAGLFTQHDYLQRVGLPELPARDTPVHRVATPIDKVAYVFIDNTIESALEIMAVMGCHHLAVLDELPTAGGTVVAITSQDELLGLTGALRDSRRAAAVAKGLNFGFIGPAAAGQEAAGKEGGAQERDNQDAGCTVTVPPSARRMQ